MGTVTGSSPRRHPILTALELDRSQARRLVLHRQGLTRPHHRAFARPGAGDDTLAATIDRLGFVQVDSIPHVERAHHMILHARSQAYRPSDLKRLHERERGVFEGWTHDASYIPAAFWPCWKHRFRRTRERLAAKFEQWQGPGFRDQCAPLLRRIREGGPLRARDLEKPAADLPMWQWHDGKAALEYLWRTGELVIAARDGFQKVYDLPERVLPREHLEGEVPEAAFIDWACRKAMDGLGFATPGMLARYLDLVTIAEAKAWAERENALVPVEVAGRRFVARPDVLDPVPDPPARLRALSPFDPVIRDRDRLAWLWDFDYRIEIYVPAAKRRWGYYVFPLLEGERMVGRVDMQAHRAKGRVEGRLHVSRVWAEGRWGAGRQRRLEGELVRQARLAGVARVTWSDDAGP